MFTLTDVQRAAGQTPTPGSADVTLTSAHFDSRRIRPGMLFVAMPGARVDGSDFVGAAFAAGAAAALCGRADPTVDRTRQVVTDDALGAFEALAGELRSGSDAAVVGVTGSNGKTTTKQAIAAALRAAAPTLATDRSENADVGVPTTLSRLAPDDRFAVIEMGAQTAGEIAAYCEYAAPNAGVITNIAGAHLGLFGSIEAVAEAKAELLAALPMGSPVVLHADDAWTPWMRTRARGPVTTFGRSAGADVRVASRLDAEAAGTQVELAVEDQTFQVRAAGVLPTVDLAFGAALATALALGVDPLTAIDGLGGFEPAPHRLQLLRSPEGALVLDDSYNANAASVAIALAALRDLPVEGQRIAVLGDMFELGEFTEREHRAVGAQAALLDRLICVGASAADIQRGALDQGLTTDRVQLFEVDPDDDTALTAALDAAASAVRRSLRPDDAVLLKASNGMRFWAIAGALLSTDRPAAAPDLA